MSAYFRYPVWPRNGSLLNDTLAPIAREGAVSLETGGNATARGFYAPFANESARDTLDAQLGAAYPQARVRQGMADPAHT